MILDCLPSILLMVGLMLTAVGVFIGFLCWTLRRELRGER